ncbi:MAG: polyprenyl synthetase family protein [candidate division KSB1 bacterium]|nr:polyprenyl synthetase family protein [candidate division KSB1 bacterium]
MGTFGDHFGMAFQIMDDVLDFIGSSDKMGKPSCKDIREKKLTLPLIHVMEQDDNKFSALIRRGLDKGFSEDEIDHIQNKVVSDGGIEFAVNRAGFYAQSALELLSVYPDNEIRQAMEKLVSSSTKREK